VINDVIESELPDLQTLALGLGKEIFTVENLSYDELSSKIDELEKVIELQQYGGHTGAEQNGWDRVRVKGRGVGLCSRTFWAALGSARLSSSRRTTSRWPFSAAM
jgi:hypothetical protein